MPTTVLVCNVDNNCDPFADIEKDNSELETNEVAVDDED